MKHRILIEFEADKLPDDFTDQVAGRIYMMPCVKKTECTATLVGDIAKDAERYQRIKSEIKTGSVQTQLPLYKVHYWMNYEEVSDYPELDDAIDAAMKGQP